MKLIASGVTLTAAMVRSPSFSRFVVDHNDHVAGADRVDRLVDGREGSATTGALGDAQRSVLGGHDFCSGWHSLRTTTIIITHLMKLNKSHVLIHCDTYVKYIH